jgi:sugar/nucleoside kinase (ribokinase family)
MDVVTIGHTSLDKVKVRGKESIQLGGASIYSALASKIFSETGVVSRVGREFPDTNLDQLAKWGLDTSGITRGTGRTTSFEISYDKEGRAIYGSYDFGVGRYIMPKDIPAKYLKAKAFHLAPMSPAKQLKFVRYLRDNSYGLISLNTHFGYVPKHKKDLLKLAGEVDVFILDHEEAMLLTGTKRIELAYNALKKKDHNIIAGTIGDIGSGVLEEGEFTYFSTPYQKEVKDFTGCGDVFGGSFISSYLKTKNPLKSANIANQVASINATDWYFKGIKGLKFQSIEAFQEFMFSRQRKLRKNQRSIEHWF